MISAMEAAVRNVKLTPEDYRLIADEIARNEADSVGETTNKGQDKEGK